MLSAACKWQVKQPNREKALFPTPIGNLAVMGQTQCSVLAEHTNKIY